QPKPRDDSNDDAQILLRTLVLFDVRLIDILKVFFYRFIHLHTKPWTPILQKLALSDGRVC
ncbi:hypothetical protein, partial [Thiolapillus sp.]|uniref:hypothetical protein n=1 Tax=Thiolapillus sp. TaxID=2017437 RepID=UPI003AF81FF3